MKLNKKSAFSLLEVAVVVIVIGILIGAIAQYSGVIRSFRLSSGQNLTTGSPVASTKGLIFWVESTLESSFESEIINSDLIATWYGNNTQSSSNINLVQAVSGGKPTYKREGIGNLPSVEFDGTDDRLNGSNLILPADYTIFVVFNAYSGSSSSNRDIISVFYDADGNFTNNNATSEALIGVATTTSYLNFVHQTNDNSSVSAITEGKGYILSSVRSLGTTDLKVWLNNTLFLGGGVTTPTVSDGAFSTLPLNITVGTMSDVTSSYRPFKGLISEIIIYNRALAQSEIDLIEDYLSKKYQIKIY